MVIEEIRKHPPERINAGNIQRIFKITSDHSLKRKENKWIKQKTKIILIICYCSVSINTRNVIKSQ